MRPSIWETASNHWRIILYTAFSIAFALGLIVYSQAIGLKVFDFIAENQDRYLSGYIKKEGEYISTSVREFAQREDVRQAVINDDTAKISDLLSAEKAKTGLSAYTVADEAGIAFTRALKHASLGDEVFLTNPIGRRVVKGDESASFGPGKNFALTFGAGKLVQDDKGITQGAVMGGYWLDNTYAEAFKNKYLNDMRHREVIFYSTEDGVTGNSITDLEVRGKLQAYINHASALITDGRSGNLLNINGTDYVITNHLIANEQGVYGGVILLTPVPGSLFVRSMLVSLLVTFLFFVSLLFLERISIPQLLGLRRKSLLALLLSLSAVVFISIWSGVYAYGRTATIDLDQPKITIYNSTMKLRPESGVYVLGYPQQLGVLVFSGGEKINAAEVNLSFDPKVIRVDALSFDRSICTPETIAEQSIDNVNGKIVVSCAVSGKAFEDPRGVVVDVNFTPLAPGDAAFIFAEGNSILAADGLGTDVLRSVTSGFYRIYSEDELSGFFSKNTYVIPYSITHQNSSKWYSSRHIIMTWSKINGANYLYEIAHDGTTTFSHPVETSSTDLAFDVKEDGIYYFKLAAKKGDSTGLISVFKIMIDSTPPDMPVIKASNLSVKKNDIVRFQLDSDDGLSGLENNYYVRVDNSTWLPTFSRIYMPFPDTGNHKVDVRVFDNAQNFSDSAVIINVKN